MADQKARWDQYDFGVYSMDSKWNDTGGVYIFARIEANMWRAVYIGICESFKNRCPTHDRWEEAKRLGATHVHAMAEGSDSNRVAIEQRLIGLFHPPLNTQHRL